DAAPTHVPGADDEVGLVDPDGIDQPRQDRRIVRPIRVHLDDDRCPAIERRPKAVEIRSTETLLRLSMEDADAWICCGELVSELAGAVGRVVIDDEQRG